MAALLGREAKASGFRLGGQHMGRRWRKYQGPGRGSGGVGPREVRGRREAVVANGRSEGSCVEVNQMLFEKEVLQRYKYFGGGGDGD